MSDPSGAAAPAAARKPRSARDLLPWLAVLVPILISTVYRSTMFDGLTNPDSLDIAQIARNLSAGRGFATSIIFPQALVHGTNPLAQPCLTRGPVYPLVVALMFGIGGAKDVTVQLASQLMYVLTAIFIYILGTRLFDRRVGIIAAAFFSLDAIMLEYSASGMPILLISLLILVLLIQLHKAGQALGDDGASFPRGAVVAVGVCCALLYLTDYVMLWILPVALVVLARMAGPRRRQALITAGVAFAIPAGLWMIRNAAVGVNPVFGLRSLEAWMNTTLYPGSDVYRMLPGELTGGKSVLRAFAMKVLLGLAGDVTSLPQLPCAWLLAFLIPSLFLPFGENVLQSLRSAAVWMFVVVVAGELAFQNHQYNFAVVVPALLVFAARYMVRLSEQARFTARTGRKAVALFAVAVFYPVVAFAVRSHDRAAMANADAAAALSGVGRSNTVVMSDAPWLVAWYGERPSVWIPFRDDGVRTVQSKLQGVDAMFLTDQSTKVSQGWQVIYGQFLNWSQRYQAAKQRNLKLPGPISIPANVKVQPLDVLGGWTALPPRGRSLAATVTAISPDLAQAMGQPVQPPTGAQAPGGAQAPAGQ